MVSESTLWPYLTFDGNAAEAMKFYHSALGGDLNMQTFAEVDMGKTSEEGRRIVHAVLKSRAITLMASDGMMGKPPKMGENVSLSLQGEDHPWLTSVFNKLSAGGKVDMPLAKQFWGDTYGMLTDKFGMHWMVNIVAPKPST